MSKYKWSLLGLILSIILFTIFFISPLNNFINKATIPAFPYPLLIPLEYKSTNPLDVCDEYIDKDVYDEWYENVPKKFNWSALSEFGKSFYHWNLFWILIIIFSFMTFNYKKKN